MWTCVGAGRRLKLLVEVSLQSTDKRETPHQRDSRMETDESERTSTRDVLGGSCGLRRFLREEATRRSEASKSALPRSSRLPTRATST